MNSLLGCAATVQWYCFYYQHTLGGLMVFVMQNLSFTFELIKNIENNSEKVRQGIMVQKH